MSWNLPLISISTASSAANGATHPLYPITSLQNVNPSTSITPSMSFSPVFRPSIPLPQREENVRTLAVEEMGGDSGYQQNGGLFRSDVQETQTGRTRHTPLQIQGLEAMFKECPNPDQEQRLKLSGDLGLNPSQVKYWFQNRRNQEKIKQERNDSAVRKAENDDFKRDIIRLLATLLGNITDGNGSEVSTEVHQLCLESGEIDKTNDKLRDVISRLGGVMHTLGRAPSPIPAPSPSPIPSPSLDSDTYRISPNPITEHLDDTEPEWLFDETIMDDWFSESGLEVQYAETGDGVGAASITPMDILHADSGQSPEAGGPHAAGELH